jgi:hypothetical protein
VAVSLGFLEGCDRALGKGNFFIGGSEGVSGRRRNSKRKGLQLALEPLDGRGIAGYVPKP